MRILVVTNMYPTLSEPGFAPFVREQVEAIERRDSIEAVDVLVIDGRASQRNYFKAYPRLWRRLRQQRYDVIHAHYGLSGLVALAQFQAPVVVTYHGSDVDGERWSNAIQRRASRLVARLVTANITVSEPIQRRLAHPSALIPCGIDMQAFQVSDQAAARIRLGLDPDALIMLFPSTPKRLEKEYPSFQKVVVAAHAMRPEVQELVLEGFSRDEVPSVMAAADVMVMTSSTEGTPVSVMEAMACGLPVVSTDVGDVRSMLSATDRAFVAPFDADRFAEAALRLADASADRTRLLGAERFEMNAIVDRIVDIYAKCQSRRAPLSLRRSRLTPTTTSSGATPDGG